MSVPVLCADVPFDGVGPFDPQARQWSDLPPYVLWKPQFYLETNSGFRHPQRQLTLAQGEVYGPGAGLGPHIVPFGDLDR